MSADSDKAIKSGCDDHIAKPTGPDFEERIQSFPQACPGFAARCSKLSIVYCIGNCPSLVQYNDNSATGKFRHLATETIILSGTLPSTTQLIRVFADSALFLTGPVDHGSDLTCIYTGFL